MDDRESDRSGGVNSGSLYVGKTGSGSLDISDSGYPSSHTGALHQITVCSSRKIRFRYGRRVV
jgi:hypothetical protein